MVDKTIPDLPAAGSVDGADLFELSQSGVSRKATRTQVIAGLAATMHGHAIADVTGLQTALDGKTSKTGTPLPAQYPRFTDPNTLEARTPAQVRADLDLEVGVDFPPLVHVHALSQVNDAADADFTYVAASHGATSAAVITVLATATRTWTFNRVEGALFGWLWLVNESDQTHSIQLQDPDDGYTTVSLRAAEAMVIVRLQDALLEPYWAAFIKGPVSGGVLAHLDTIDLTTHVAGLTEERYLGGHSTGAVLAIARDTLTDDASPTGDFKLLGFNAAGARRTTQASNLVVGGYPAKTTNTVAGTTQTLDDGTNVNPMGTRQVYTAASAVAVTVTSTIPANAEWEARRQGTGSVTYTGVGLTFNGTSSISVVGTASFKREGTSTDINVEGETGETSSLAATLDAAGNIIKGNRAQVDSVSGALTSVAHSGGVWFTSGNVTVPNGAGDVGFNATFIAGGAHTVAFGATVSPAMAAGDVMTVVVQSPTVIKATLVAAANLVAFT